MRVLTLDIGNTRSKYRVFADGHIVERGDWKSLQALEVIPNAAVLSITTEVSAEVLALNTLMERVLLVKSDTPIPLKIDYETPQTLGPDRITAAVGAHKLFPEQDLVVFDFGTCITCDLVTRNGTFCGGAISPGVRMRLEAMHSFTSRLPLVEVKHIDYLSGKSTEASLLSGTINGCMFEAKGFIDAYRTLYPDLKVLITGGDAPLFENRLKNGIFAAPDLNFIGLYEIFEYNYHKGLV